MRAWPMIAVLWLNSSASAEVFRWVDQNGGVHFGDQPPHAADAERLDLHINSYESPSVTENDFAGTREVTLYSAMWCKVCKKAKRYFEKNVIPFVEYDIETSAQGRRDYLRLGGRGVPIILVGDKRLNGFSPTTFDKVYNSW